MQGYQYDFLGSDGRLQAALTLHAYSDDQASEVGSRILAGSECFMLKIRRDDALIFQIERDAARERGDCIDRRVLAAA